MAGYHKCEIEKGELSSPSKIREEFEEYMDAINQKNPIMAILELSDLLGAIESYAAKFNLTMNDLLVMTRATQNAFQTGRRK